jgi:E3 ubiquitin-protein ligase BRE1
LLSVDSQNFEEHLASRSSDIQRAISAIYSKAPAAPPEVQALQQRVNELLAQEKGYINEVQRLSGEIDSVTKRLDDAVLRYMVAEKRLDKAKSAVVANIEKQGQLGATVTKQETEDKVNGEAMNGVKSEAPAVVNEEAERERVEAVALAAKAKEQLAQLEEQNLKLTTELTTAKAKYDSLSDEDYAGTELFKIVKSQLEEALNKVNDLEAINIKLRDEAKQAQAERTAYRTKLDEEALASTSSTEQLLAARDADLQRVRAARDDAHFKFQSLDTLVHDHKATAESATALANSRADRITALENEVERLRTRCGELHADVTDTERSSTDHPQLQQTLADLRREIKTLEGELPSIEQAYKKAQAAAAAKYAGYEQMDQQLSALKTAKGRADQKYFGMMKYKEQLEAEVATLRKAEKTSSGIITSLKNSDAMSRELVVNLERQGAEYVDTINRMNQDHFALEAKANQALLQAQNFQKQVVKFQESLSEKDSACSVAGSSMRESQREVEALKARLDMQTKEVTKLKKAASKNDSQEVKDLRVRVEHFEVFHFCCLNWE